MSSVKKLTVTMPAKDDHAANGLGHSSAGQRRKGNQGLGSHVEDSARCQWQVAQSKVRETVESIPGEVDGGTGRWVAASSRLICLLPSNKTPSYLTLPYACRPTGRDTLTNRLAVIVRGSHGHSNAVATIDASVELNPRSGDACSSLDHSIVPSASAYRVGGKAVASVCRWFDESSTASGDGSFRKTWVMASSAPHRTLL